MGTAAEISQPEEGNFDWMIRIMGGSPDLGDSINRATREVLRKCPPNTETASVEMWLERAKEGDAQTAEEQGYELHRTLWQMECPLPLKPAPKKQKSGHKPPQGDFSLRSFEPTDLRNFTALHNRVFEWHPDESNLTSENFQKRMSESWYDARGFLLCEETESGALAGFCWTKVHKDVSFGNSPSKNTVGEIYIIGVSPDFQKRGLGEFLSRAGYDHLHQSGITKGMLFVEADNHPAISLYERIGLRHSRTDMAFTRHVKPENE